jgi:peptidoglycan hydrolase CwlO-like protein
MAYTLTLLTTAAECDAVLKYAKNDKKDLQYKKLQLTRSLEDFNENSTELNDQLAALTAEVTTLTTVIAGLADGPYKTEQNKKLKKAEYSLFLATSRKNKNGSPAQLERELELEQADQQIAAVETFISQVTTHKAGL